MVTSKQLLLRQTSLCDTYALLNFFVAQKHSHKKHSFFYSSLLWLWLSSKWCMSPLTFIENNSLFKTLERRIKLVFRHVLNRHGKHSKKTVADQRKIKAFQVSIIIPTTLRRQSSGSVVHLLMDECYNSGVEKIIHQLFTLNVCLS